MRLNGKRILIIEDNRRSALDLTSAFQAAGAVVLGPAPTVFYASQLIGRRGIDCAVVGGDLPQSERSQFLSHLASCGTPVVVLSADGDASFAPAKALPRLTAPQVVVDSTAKLLHRGSRDNLPINLTSKRAVKALGLYQDNPHMRVVRVWSDARRRRAAEETRENP